MASEKIYAFPCKEIRTLKGGGDYTKYYQGMDLRDYFAVETLVAFMSNASWVNGLDEEAAISKIPFKIALAQQCYVMADAMMEERKKL